MNLIKFSRNCQQKELREQVEDSVEISKIISIDLNNKMQYDNSNNIFQITICNKNFLTMKKINKLI